MLTCLGKVEQGDVGKGSFKGHNIKECLGYFIPLDVGRKLYLWEKPGLDPHLKASRVEFPAPTLNGGITDEVV